MIRRILAFLVRLTTGVRTAPELGEIHKRRIYLANHSSHLDALVLWSAIPTLRRHATRPVAAAEYWQKGRLRRWLATRAFNAILIPRHLANMRDEDPLEKMLAAIDNGADLILFPEGTRSKDGGIGPFKSGIYHLASKRPELELIPVFLENLGRILPKGELLPLPLIARATFGHPISGPDPTEPKTDFLARARDAVVQLSAN